MVTVGLIAVGLILLTGGAELLVRGAAQLATLFGVPALIVGLTVVAYGTSAPELAVSTLAAWRNDADIALGNVVGSNIYNILAILGPSALIAPLIIATQVVRLDLWVMIGVSLVAFAMALDGRVSRSEGLVLAVGSVAYTLWLIRLARREANAVAADALAAVGAPPPARSARSYVVSLALVLIGLVLLVLGSRWLVQGAVALATWLGVSELVIGLTIVAAGTSLPETATSIVAAIRGQRDIAVGNVVGSNIFNLLAVLGAAAAIAPAGIAVAASALRFDMVVMVLVALACGPIFLTGKRIDRVEGALLLAGYGAYIGAAVWFASARS